MTDEQLMALIKAGQLHHAGELFVRHHLRVLKYIAGWTRNLTISEDVAAGTFLAIIERCESYDPNQPFDPWLFTIARNLARRYLRGSMREGFSTPEMPDPRPSPHDEYQRVEDLQRISKALNSLKAPEREILSLAKELSHREIASIIKCKEGAVKHRLCRALKNLRGKYDALQRRGV